MPDSVQQFVHDFLRFAEGCDGNYGIHRNAEFRNRFVDGADQFNMDRSLRIRLFLFELGPAPQVIEPPTSMMSPTLN